MGERSCKRISRCTLQERVVTVEIEYKWDMPSDEKRDQLLDLLRERGELGQADSIRMHARYYDTEDGYIQNIRGGLRTRTENERSICCLKLSAGGNGGFRTRQEYEVEADDVFEGLRLLKSVGAPEDICDDLASRKLEAHCETNFLRTEYDFRNREFEAKLALDSGFMERQGRQAPISEIEFEFVGGSEEAFHGFADDLAKDCELAVQPKSKLARAASL